MNRRQFLALSAAIPTLSVWAGEIPEAYRVVTRNWITARVWFNFEWYEELLHAKQDHDLLFIYRNEEWKLKIKRISVDVDKGKVFATATGILIKQ